MCLRRLFHWNVYIHTRVPCIHVNKLLRPKVNIHWCTVYDVRCTMYIEEWCDGKMRHIQIRTHPHTQALTQTDLYTLSIHIDSKWTINSKSHLHNGKSYIYGAPFYQNINTILYIWWCIHSHTHIYVYTLTIIIYTNNMH